VSRETVEAEARKVRMAKTKEGREK